MIKADMHLHTCYSHGSHNPFEMHIAATLAGLELMGFSEHSPRPLGYSCTHEYRDQLTAYLPTYLKEVAALKKKARADREQGRMACQVLLGLEMDWLDGQEDFISKAIAFGDYDFVLGSVHYLGSWAFDDGQEPWLNLPQEQCDRHYERYFAAWRNMINSGFFEIASHPDLIKIFSVGQFHNWLERPESQRMVRDCLLDLRRAGMAMEISSAGLRKACREIYPCPQIMQMAAELELPVSLASDAHCMADVAYSFADLANYAKSFGFDRQTVYDRGKSRQIPF